MCVESGGEGSEAAAADAQSKGEAEYEDMGGDCLTLGDQSQSQPITFPGSANCPMKHLAEKFMSGAARTLQVWGNEGARSHARATSTTVLL